MCFSSVTEANFILGLQNAYTYFLIASITKFRLSNLEHCYVRIDRFGNNRIYFKASRNNEVQRFVDTIVIQITLLFKSYNTLHKCKNNLGLYVLIVP
jgi:hypothetical protein